MASGAALYATSDGLKRRNFGREDSEIEDIISKTSSLNLADRKMKFSDIWATTNENPESSSSDHIAAGQGNSRYGLFNWSSIIILTAISAFVRLYQISKTNYVVWDEAHFGKFGSHYIQHEYYFDVHPPLGKLLVGLSGYLAGYDGSFAFESGHHFPETLNFQFMRTFNAFFGILCTPIAYQTAVLSGFLKPTVWLITLLVVFEMISLTLAKFILLDSMLLFFTVTTFYCLVKLHKLRLELQLLSKRGLLWLAITGVSIGCVCSVKWVGLFITCVVGLYTIFDLYIKYCEFETNQTSFSTYFKHWIARIFTLILIPFTIYLACFKIHFMVLNKSGSGDGSVSSLLQASFENNSIEGGPRTVRYGSMVTMRSHGLSPNLLHSHPSRYPEGSLQQQVTTYGYKDNNNEFLIEFDLESGNNGEFATYEPLEGENITTRPLLDGDIVRFVHKDTGCLLHSHAIPAAISKSQNEVSCYSSLEASDPKDEWILEIQVQEESPDSFFANESKDEVHPISTNFRLKHRVLGCYLATSGYSYPAWGFGQGEVICKHSFVGADKTTWWNVEDHVNPSLELPEKAYMAPKPKFWKEFIMLNYAMMSSNNALLPDPDRFDKLSSEWWQWPILQIGLRMCSWTSTDVKYFLMGNPVVTWGSTALIGCFVIYTIVLLWLWQRQRIVYHGGILDSVFNQYLIQGLAPFVAWLFNYYPFIAMGRVTYLHHYAPALYFGIFVLGFVIEQALKKLPKLIRLISYAVLYAGIIGMFYYLKDFSFGMEGPSINFQHLKLLETWMV